jgi:hypothetical protein
LFGIRFTPAALLGFETMLAKLAKLAEPVVQDIAKKLASSDGMPGSISSTVLFSISLVIRALPTSASASAMASLIVWLQIR